MTREEMWIYLPEAICEAVGTIVIAGGAIWVFVWIVKTIIKDLHS